MSTLLDWNFSCYDLVPFPFHALRISYYHAIPSLFFGAIHGRVGGFD